MRLLLAASVIGTVRELPAQYELKPGWESRLLTTGELTDVDGALRDGNGRSREIDCNGAPCADRLNVLTMGPRRRERLSEHIERADAVVVGRLTAPVGGRIERRYRIRQSSAVSRHFYVAMTRRAPSDPNSTSNGVAIVGRWFLVQAVKEPGQKWRLQRYAVGDTPIAGHVARCTHHSAVAPADFLSCGVDALVHRLSRELGTPAQGLLGCASFPVTYVAEYCLRTIAEAYARRTAPRLHGRAAGGAASIAPRPPARSDSAVGAGRLLAGDWRPRADTAFAQLKALRGQVLQEQFEAPFWFQCDGGCCTAERMLTPEAPAGR